MPFYSEEELVELMKFSGVEPGNIESILQKKKALDNGEVRFDRKDTMPVGGRPGPGGRLYDGGPFNPINSEVYSTISEGGSDLARWIPTRKMNSRYTLVNHLEYLAPKGYDPGSQTYQEWLAGVEIPVCGYGPNATWSGFTYSQGGGSFSFSTDQMQPIEDGGLPYYEQIQLYTINTFGRREQIKSDADWAVALLLKIAEQHVDWVLINGRKSNSDMEFDGLLTQMVPGYIASKVQGTGIPHAVDPFVINGAALITAADVLAQIHIMVRVTLNRIKLVNQNVMSGDMSIVMPGAAWDNLAEHVAAGGVDRFDNLYNFDGRISQLEFLDRLDRVRQTGTISVDGLVIPVLRDNHLGVSTTVGGAAAVTTDILLLTRSVGGLTLLSQDWYDWSSFASTPEIMQNRQVLQGGYAHLGWVTEASACYYYFIKMYGRLASMMHNYQARLNSVSIPVLDTNEVISGSFTSPDFYPYKGHGSLEPVV